MTEIERNQNNYLLFILLRSYFDYNRLLEILVRRKGMHPAKYFWALRALMYKASFKHIGNLTYMGKSCFIAGRKRISIGNRTRIFPSIRMEAIGSGTIEIGNNCAIEQNVHIISGGGY